MKLRTVTAIHSCPRSGSSWLLNVFNSAPNTKCLFQPLFSYTHKDKLNEFSSGHEISGFFEEIYNTDDNFALMNNEWFFDNKGARRYPFFKKNKIPRDLVFKHVRYHHLLQNLLHQNSQIKVIGIVRDPRATINSFLNTKEFKPEWDISAEWRFAPRKNKGMVEEFYGYERWKDTTRIFLNLEEIYPQRFRIVRYIDMVKKTEEIVRHLFDFSGLKFSEETRRFVAESKSQDSDDYGIYRVKSDDFDWKNSLDQKIIDAIEEDLGSSDNENLLRFLDS